MNEEQKKVLRHAGGQVKGAGRVLGRILLGSRFRQLETAEAIAEDQIGAEKMNELGAALREELDGPAPAPAARPAPPRIELEGDGAPAAPPKRRLPR